MFFLNDFWLWWGGEGSEGQLRKSPEKSLTSFNTFPPPRFHRNCMSEFMGLLTGEQWPVEAVDV